MRVVAINLDHRTRRKPVPPELLAGLVDLTPDLLVLTEYVEPTPRSDVRQALRNAGLEYVATSRACEYKRGAFSNQVLIASRGPLRVLATPTGAPNCSAYTNLLAVESQGLTFSGVRVPYYRKTADWHAYWSWLEDAVNTHVLVGDLNADPWRGSGRDQSLDRMIDRRGWNWVEPEGPWSYMGRTGIRSRIDHILVRAPVRGARAQYRVQPFAPRLTDHAALVADLEVDRSPA